MKSTILVDGKELKLNRFISELSGNLIDAIARSLKFADGKVVRIRLRAEEIRMFIDDREVSLELGHAGQIVRGVLQGFLTHLYGAENAQETELICER